MESLLEPPALLPPLKNSDVRTCKRGTRFWRIHFRGGDHPCEWNSFRYFGPTSSRFDHHLAPRGDQERGVLYATFGTSAIRTALAEVFQDTRQIDLNYKDPWLVAFELTAPIRLVDTSGSWPVRVGANMAINSGPRDKSRLWSQALYRDYPTVDGVWYSSSINNEPCVALYERALRALPAHPVFLEPLASPKLLARLAAAAKLLNFTL